MLSETDELSFSAIGPEKEKIVFIVIVENFKGHRHDMFAFYLGLLGILNKYNIYSYATYGKVTQ